MNAEWQPIETAPKDGRRVMLWWPYWCSDYPVVGHWQVNGGWQCEWKLSDGDDPTHWMPLPKPPAVANSSTDKE